jgi:hypothetical protein
MSIVYNKGDIVISKDKDKPNLRILRVDNFEDENEEYNLVEIDQTKLKEFKHKTTDEITFVLQILGKESLLQRSDVQRLFKSNFIFDYDLYTFNAYLSDGAICVIQHVEKTKNSEKTYKVIISNKDRNTQMSGRGIDIDECFQYIELYLIRNKPSLTFDYFKENLAKYRKEVSANREPIATEEVTVVDFSDISPDPLSKEEIEAETETETETETVEEKTQEEENQNQEQA